MPVVTITFAPNAPGPQQIQCNPDPVPVPYGNAQTVTFNLSGPSGAAFSGTDGIYFKDASPGTLVRVSDTQYQLTDDNGNTTGQPVEYPYGINISYGGSQYSKDPEVENDTRPGQMALHYHSA